MKFSLLITLTSCLILLYFGSSNSVEYTASQADCTKSTPVVNYNISTLKQCLTLCLLAQCFYANYTGSTCTSVGHNPKVRIVGQISLDAYRPMVLKNVAGPDNTVAMSSTYIGDPQPSVASNAIDQDNSTLACTNNEDNPWLSIDLEQNYYLQHLNFIIRSVQYARWSSIKIYFSATSVAPAQYSTLPVYASYAGSIMPISSVDFKSEKSPGPCGRYLVVQRIGSSVMLEILEISIYVL